ncbi:MAG: uracil-DNA glycosylase [Candidatus Saccharibacteria bacterium]
MPGEGNPDADVVFLGEAPGRTESETGRPFVGRSGQYLRQLIRSLGLDDVKDVYITSPVKYFPKQGHGPKPSEILHGKQHLMDQLKVIQPKFIVLLGNTAISAMLGKSRPALSHHGTFMAEEGTEFYLTIHPAAAIRFKKFRKIIEADFRRLGRLLSNKFAKNRDLRGIS